MTDDISEVSLKKGVKISKKETGIKINCREISLRMACEIVGYFLINTIMVIRPKKLR